MLDWLRGLFGKGKVRTEFTTLEGKSGTIKIDYLGDPDTLDEQELRGKCRDLLLVEHGLHLDTFRIIGITRD